MKGLVTAWMGRVAPVFGSCRHGVLIEHLPGGGLSTRKVDLPPGIEKIVFLLDHNIHYLVCGAIRRPFRQTLEGRGIRVYGFVCGSIDEILEACESGSVEAKAFSMPGCGFRGRCGRRRKGDPGSIF